MCQHSSLDRSVIPGLKSLWLIDVRQSFSIRTASQRGACDRTAYREGRAIPIGWSNRCLRRNCDAQSRNHLDMDYNREFKMRDGAAERLSYLVQKSVLF